MIMSQEDYMKKEDNFNVNGYIGSPKHLANLREARKLVGTKKLPCQYCNKLIINVIKHELQCHLNPVNMKYCFVCKGPITTYRGKKTRNNPKLTCSYACSNKLHRSGPNHKSWKEDAYVSTCFYYHKKECVVCGESNIVEVHHFDEDHQNNTPSNLIPLCPTHHKYWHSRHKHLIEDVVTKYRTKWLQQNSL